MSRHSLLNAHALALTTVLLDLVDDCIRPEERGDALDEFYAAAKSALARYEQALSNSGSTVRLGLYRSEN
jgi:hypothetical protein